MKGLDHPNIGKSLKRIFANFNSSFSSQTFRSYRNGKNSLSCYGICQWRYVCIINITENISLFIIGEVFDYLVAHGRMKEKEARSKFRQVDCFNNLNNNESLNLDRICRSISSSKTYCSSRFESTQL
jgi:hypothetical protein